MGRRHNGPPVLIAVAALLAAAAPARAADHEIGSASDYYSPPYLRIAVGDRVEWSPSVLHPLKFDADPPGTPERTSTPYTRTFSEPGVIDFYCSNHGGAGRTGMSGRVVVGDANEPPDAALALSTERATVGQSVDLDASGSRDPEGGAVGYDWDLDGDGTYELLEGGPLQRRSWPDTGTFVVGVRVRDLNGGTDTARRAVRVSAATAEPPPPPGGGGPPGGTGGGDTPPPGGADPPATRDRIAPTVKVASPKGSISGLSRRGLVMKLTLSEPAEIRVSAVVKAGKRSASLRGYRRRLAAGRVAVELRASSAVRRALKGSKRARVTVTIRAVDAAGNRVDAKRSLTVK